MRCRICGNEQGNSDYVAKEMMFGFRISSEYFQCGDCGCLQIASFPLDMSRYYPSSYWRNEPRRAPRKGIKGWARERRDEFAALRRGLVGRVLWQIHPNEGLRKAVAERFPGGGVSVAGLRTDSRVLDVGCGTGGFLITLSEAGFRRSSGSRPLRGRGHRISGWLAGVERNHRRLQGDLGHHHVHHSFEHIRDPEETLNAAANLLAEEGTIVVRIPVVSSYAWERYGVDWVQLDASPDTSSYIRDKA